VIKKIQTNAHVLPHILNCLFDRPMTIGDLSIALNVRYQDIRNVLVTARKNGLAHISEYRISEIYTRQPVMVFAFGPGKDAVRLGKAEMERRQKPRAAVMVRRDPLTSALFGSHA
jgi:hypothetical protein